MSISAARPVSVRFESDRMIVVLDDDRMLVVALSNFPKLCRASTRERENLRISRRGLHWDELDEDISIAGLLAGHDRDLTKKSFAH